MTNNPEQSKKLQDSVTLDQLTQDVNETKKSLDALKQETQSSEREKKTEVIKTQISILKSKISEALQKETDEVKKQKILELQKQLEGTGMELSSLEQEIVDKQEAGTSVEKKQGLWDRSNYCWVLEKRNWYECSEDCWICCCWVCSTISCKRGLEPNVLRWWGREKR